MRPCQLAHDVLNNTCGWIELCGAKAFLSEHVARRRPEHAKLGRGASGRARHEAPPQAVRAVGPFKESIAIPCGGA